MAYQNNKSKVTTAAKGDAKGGVKIGPTPAPVRKYRNPILTERTEPLTYGGAKNLGPSSVSADPNDPHGYGQRDLGPVSVDPSQTRTSPLADELKRVAAEGDGGDVLQDVIERGTARDVTSDLGGSPQTRAVSDKGLAPSFGMKLPNMKAGSYGTLPAKLGATTATPVRKP
jgi:hypothetical protein